MNELLIVLIVLLGVNIIAAFYTNYCFCVGDYDIDEKGEDEEFKSFSKVMVIIGILLLFLSILVLVWEYDNAKRLGQGEFEALHEGSRAEAIARDIWLASVEGDIDEYDRLKELVEKSKSEWEAEYIEEYIPRISYAVPVYIFITGVLFPLYMYPTKVARKKRHEQYKAITWLNYLFGCTLIVWVALLIWSNSSSDDKTLENGAAYSRLTNLQKLLDSKMITEAEFEAKKKEILEKI